MIIKIKQEILLDFLDGKEEITPEEWRRLKKRLNKFFKGGFYLIFKRRNHFKICNQIVKEFFQFDEWLNVMSTSFNTYVVDENEPAYTYDLNAAGIAFKNAIGISNHGQAKALLKSFPSTFGDYEYEMALKAILTLIMESSSVEETLETIGIIKTLDISTEMEELLIRNAMSFGKTSWHNQDRDRHQVISAIEMAKDVSLHEKLKFLNILRK